MDLLEKSPYRATRLFSLIIEFAFNWKSHFFVVVFVSSPTLALFQNEIFNVCRFYCFSFFYCFSCYIFVLCVKMDGISLKMQKAQNYRMFRHALFSSIFIFIMQNCNREKNCSCLCFCTIAQSNDDKRRRKTTNDDDDDDDERIRQTRNGRSKFIFIHISLASLF